MTEAPIIERVRALIAPIVADLGLDLYDLEQHGATLRVTLDTPAGSASSVDLNMLALATRLVSRELDHSDPVPGRYTLEVTSPGVERRLRTAEHFRREIGKQVSVRLHDVGSDERRFEGVLVGADDRAATFRVGDTERVVAYDTIDRARTVFVWGPQPKPTGPGRRTKSGRARSADKESAS